MGDINITNYELVQLIESKIDSSIIDTFWLIFCGTLVFFMQCGFAMLEVGTVQKKNTKNILMKNILDASIGAILWWAIGYPLAYDGNDNSFIGTASDGGPSFFTWRYSDDETSSGYSWALWFFQYVFAATASTIVSGAVAERTQLAAYMIYTVFMTGFIYPVMVHWVWSSSGWLSAFNTGSPLLGGVIDFAGSGVVHMTGGVAALAGAYIVGPRLMRFNENGEVLDIEGHSTTFQVLGTFILWLGWYGFNAGSTLGLSGTNYTRDAARTIVTTSLSAASGGIGTLLLDKWVGSRSWCPSALSNGILSGLVSITASCVVVQPWASVIIGFSGSVVYFGTSQIILYKFRVDDPLDAFAIHGACGAWGVLAAGLFCDPKYSYIRGGGLFYGDHNAVITAIVLIGSNIVWVGSLSAVMFMSMKKMNILRITEEQEKIGLDMIKHGGSEHP
jgi:ammonium transporter, Amt family